MHLPTCAVCVAVTLHVRCEHSRPGACPMNTATVSLHAGRGRSKCGQHLSSLWIVSGENDWQRFENRRGTDQHRRLGPRGASEIDETHQATAQFPLSASQHDSLWESSPRCFKHSPDSTLLRVCAIWEMLGCCARLHVWTPRSQRCLSSGLQPNRLLDAHFKKRENEQERGRMHRKHHCYAVPSSSLFHEVRSWTSCMCTFRTRSFSLLFKSKAKQMRDSCLRDMANISFSRRVKSERCSGTFVRVHRVLNQELRWELPPTCTFHVFPCLGTTGQSTTDSFLQVLVHPHLH